jgi:hypothetical protein
MLFPRSHPWSRRQKWLIIGSAVAALATCGALVYGFERYYRGPGQELLYGTWDFDGVGYVEFNQNHTFSVFDEDEPHSPFVRGTWYAGGRFLYMGFPLSFRPNGNTLEVWRIADISSEQISVRYCQYCMEHVFQRIDPAVTRASNQAMQRTAGPSEF